MGREVTGVGVARGGQKSTVDCRASGQWRYPALRFVHGKGRARDSGWERGAVGGERESRAPHGGKNFFRWMLYSNPRHRASRS